MSEIRDRISDVICENRKLKRKLNELIDELNSISADIGKQDVDILDYSDGYCKGRDDAWECARKISCLEIGGGVTDEELRIIFGTDSNPTIMRDLSASEAIERIKNYEAEQEEQKQILVGDEVEAFDSHRRAFVIFPNGDNSQAGVIDEKGRFTWWTKIAFKKTGRHFDEIETLLEKMRESE